MKKIKKLDEYEEAIRKDERRKCIEEVLKILDYCEMFKDIKYKGFKEGLRKKVKEVGK